MSWHFTYTGPVLSLWSQLRVKLWLWRATRIVKRMDVQRRRELGGLVWPIDGVCNIRPGDITMIYPPSQAVRLWPRDPHQS